MLFKNSNNRLLLINTISLAAQVVIVSASYFILYKLIIESFGEVVLGIWSLILATSSIANISSLGLSNSIVKFIANFSSSNDDKQIKQFIQTAYVSVGILFLIIVSVIYVTSEWFLGRLIPQEHLADARDLMKWSLICFWLNGVGSIFISALDGLQLIYQRNILTIITTVALLVFSYYLKIYGIVGIAYAQLIQSILLFTGSILLLGIRLKCFSFLNFVWNKQSFLEMFNYGGKMQLVGVMNIFWEPMNKFFFSLIGDFSSLATYEMASRLVSQVRNLLVQSNQSIIPYIASKPDISPETLSAIYHKNLNVLGLLSLPIMFGIVCYTPYLSSIFLGRSDSFFNYTVILLSLAWLVNIFSAPSYFIYLGTGELNNVIKTHFIYSVVNPIVCIVLMSYFKSYGIVFSISVALILGSLFNIHSFIKKYNIIIDFFDKPFYIISVLFMFTIQFCLVWGCFYLTNLNTYFSLTLSLLLVATTYAIFLKWCSLGKFAIDYIFTLLK